MSISRVDSAEDDGVAASPASPGLGGTLGVAAVASALVWSYAPSFRALLHQWDRDPNYSHGYFVVPIALTILWTRRDRLGWERVRPRWWGLAPLLAVMAARNVVYEWNEQYVETATIPLAVGALVLALGGWRLLWDCLPSVLFLFFMLPLPPSVNQWLATWLQSVATQGSVALLEVLGLPVMAEGNVILVGAETLEVARACNGLSMLLSFVTLMVATALLVRRSWGERLVLLLSAVPIALVSNVLRIAATAVVYHHVGREWGDKLAHDFAGWAMMPIALALVWLELSILSWLIVEVVDVDPTPFLRRGRGAAGGVAR